MVFYSMSQLYLGIGYSIDFAQIPQVTSKIMPISSHLYHNNSKRSRLRISKLAESRNLCSGDISNQIRALISLSITITTAAQDIKSADLRPQQANILG